MYHREPLSAFDRFAEAAETLPHGGPRANPVVDLSEEPDAPPGSRVILHCVRDAVIDLAAAELVLGPNGRDLVSGGTYDLLCLTVLNRLLLLPEFIPVDWKGKIVVFRGSGLIQGSNLCRPALDCTAGEPVIKVISDSESWYGTHPSAMVHQSAFESRPQRVW